MNILTIVDAVNMDDTGIVSVVVEIRLDEIFRLGVDVAGKIYRKPRRTLSDSAGAQILRKAVTRL